jgi:protoporphyrinogen/coproporphyrinogen III oxidase
MRVECVIVGGGISGLAAAHELQRQRIPFVLVERAARFGGVIRTEHVDGFVVDAGADALLTQKPAGMALCEELGVELSPAQSTRAFIAHQGRLRALPDAGVFGIPTDWKSFARSRAFSTAGKLRMAGEYFLPASLSNADESIASFMTRRFGRQALQRLGEPLLAGIHGGDAERLSMRALFPRFLDLERTDGSVIRGLRRLRRNKSLTVPIAPFVSIRGGTETLVQALVASLPASSLRTEVEVTGLEQGREWRVHFGDGTQVDAAVVLLATPPRALAWLVREIDPDLSSLFSRVRDVSLITVALGYRRAAVRYPLTGSGFVVTSSERASVNAVTWMSSKWKERAPADGVLLRASVGGARNPDVSAWSSAELLVRVRNDVRRYLGVTSEPVFSRMYRMPHAGVQLEVGHLNLIAEVQARLDLRPGLFVSAAGVRGVGIADCIGDARAQAIGAAHYVRRKERQYVSAAGG